MDEGFFQRLFWSLPKRPICLPVAHSSPSVDGNGVVFIGHASGLFIGVKDWNKDGKISDEEVSIYDTEAAYLHSGPAFAPGIICNGLVSVYGGMPIILVTELAVNRHRGRR